MSTWILILTITTIKGIAVTSVPGFNVQSACVAAGNAFVRNTGGRDFWRVATAVCVENPR